MDVSKYLKSEVLKKEHCPIVLTITNTEERDWSRDSREEDLKLVIDSEEHFIRTLNDQNLRAIIKLYGPESDGWIGKQIGFIWDPTFEFKERGTGEIRSGMVKAVPPNEIPQPKKRLPTLKRRAEEPARNEIPF